MSDQVTTAHVQEYSSNLRLLLQQEQSRLRMAVSEGTHVGKHASPVDQIGAVEAEDYDVRHADSPMMDTPHEKRWVAPRGCHVGDMVDDEDIVRVLTDLKTGYARNHAAAIRRKIDRRIFDGMFGTNKTGEDGTTSTTWTAFVAANATHQVAAAGTGLTVPKLKAAKKALMAAEVDLDMDPIYCAITAEDHDDLLGEAQIISRDYNDLLVLKEGKIERFLGITFIHTELVPTTSGERQVPVWAKSGIHLGVWKDIEGMAARRPDKSFNWYAYARAIVGATRTEEKKLVEIRCV